MKIIFIIGGFFGYLLFPIYEAISLKSISCIIGTYQELWPDYVDFCKELWYERK